jgi:hypothetical protein
MNIPLPNVPTYEITLPVSKKVIKYRPFLVKEEKILLLANETEDIKQITLAIDQVLQACTFDKINVKDLPIADVEFLFLKIRAISIGELMSVIYKCPHCEEKIPYNINIENVIVENNIKDHNIKIDDSTIITMTYPTREMTEDMEVTAANMMTESIVRCVSMITINDVVYMAEDMNIEDIRAYLDNLTIPQKNKLIEFVNDLPFVRYADTIVCPKCNNESDLVLEGLYDFFG